MLPHTSKQLFSEAGTCTMTAATGAITGEFCEILFLATTTFTTLTDSGDTAPSALGGTGSSVAAAQTYPAGASIKGRFTVIDLASGVARVTLASNRA